MSRSHIPPELRQRVTEEARQRCGYCLTAQAVVGSPMEIDHIVGITAVGRATVQALKLNRSTLVAARRRWVEVGWHPPD